MKLITKYAAIGMSLLLTSLNVTAQDDITAQEEALQVALDYAVEPILKKAAILDSSFSVIDRNELRQLAHELNVLAPYATELKEASDKATKLLNLVNKFDSISTFETRPYDDNYISDLSFSVIEMTPLPDILSTKQREAEIDSLGLAIDNYKYAVRYMESLLENIDEVLEDFRQQGETAEAIAKSETDNVLTSQADAIKQIRMYAYLREMMDSMKNDLSENPLADITPYRSEISRMLNPEPENESENTEAETIETEALTTESAKTDDTEKNNENAEMPDITTQDNESTTPQQ